MSTEATKRRGGQRAGSRAPAFLAVGMLSSTLVGCDWWLGRTDGDCEPLHGRIEENLALGQGCYRIDGTLRVAQGGRLAVPGGTELQFGPAGQLVVHGGFDARGTAADPVRLTGEDDWGGVLFTPGSDGSLTGTEIDGGGFGPGADPCGRPRACLTIAPGADVTLQQVGLQGCAAEGVSGEPAAAQSVGCDAVGVCLVSDDPVCSSWDGDWRDGWCEDDGCEDQGWDSEEEEVAGACEPGQRRCTEDRFVQACLGGQWAAVADCADDPAGQTACRDIGGFPRCGLPAPAECLGLAETVTRSFVPACDERGCPDYVASCQGAGEASDCNEPSELVACLHPQTASNTTLVGLGPRWMRFIAYNWGGRPDTSNDTIRFWFQSDGAYGISIWSPPREGSERAFCTPYSIEREVRGGRIEVGVIMPPAGKQQEFILEVHAPRPQGIALPDGAIVYPKDGHYLPEPDGTSGQWRAEFQSFETRSSVGTGDIASQKYPTCEYWQSLGQPELTNGACVNPEGWFEDPATGEVFDHYPNVSTWPVHANSSVRSCHTWTLDVEYPGG